MRSNSLLLLGILLSIIGVSVFGWEVSLGFGPQEHRYEVIEPLTPKWKVRSRYVERRGDILGRGKYYDPGVKSLLFRGKMLLDRVHTLERTKGDAWAFVTTLKDPQAFIRDREVHVVNFHTGDIVKVITLPGEVVETSLSLEGLHFAIGSRDQQYPGMCHVFIVKTDEPGFVPREVFSGKGRSVVFPCPPWSPDNTSLAFVITADAGPYELVHVRCDVHTQDVISRTRCNCFASLDWSDPLEPKLKF